MFWECYTNIAVQVCQMQLPSLSFVHSFGFGVRQTGIELHRHALDQARKSSEFQVRLNCCIAEIAPQSRTRLTSAHPLASKSPEPPAEPLANLAPRHFINLTNGIEALPQMESLLPESELRFTRIQSSHCESGAYDKLLASLDNELLFSLACGRDCYVYDFGSRNKSRGVPRALFMGLEFIKWSVSYLWFKGDQDAIPEKTLVRGKNTVPFWRDKVLPYMIAKDTKKKVRYFAPFAKEMGVNEVKLHGVYGRVSEIDGCKDIHVEMVKDWLARESGNREDGDGDDNVVGKRIRSRGFAEFRAESTGEELVSIQEWMEGFR